MKATTVPYYSLLDLVMFFLKPGTIGPVAWAGSMHRDLDDNRTWIEEEGYNEGMALSQSAPVPLARINIIAIAALLGSLLNRFE